MQPFLLLIGTTLLAVAKAATLSKVLTFLAATVGSMLVALANRGKIPMVKNLPRVVVPGSVEAAVLSLALFIVGGTCVAVGMAGLMTAVPSALVLAFGSGCLLFFDRDDVNGIAPDGPGPAAFVAVLLCVLSAVTAPGCATFGPFGPPAIDIGECAVAKVCQQVAQIKPQVLNCLNTGEYLPCLESIGKTVGEAVLVCAVREFTGVGAAPASDPIVRQRAQDFLATKNLKGG